MTTPERPVDWTYGVDQSATAQPTAGQPDAQPAAGQPYDPYAQATGQPFAQPADQQFAQPYQQFAQPDQTYVQPSQPFAQPGQPYEQPGQPYAQPADGQLVDPMTGQPYAQPAGQTYVEPPIAGLPYNAQAPVEQQPYYPPAPPAMPYQPVPYQQPYQQQPYGYPQQGPYQHLQAQPTNGMAIAAMVLGILWLYWIGSILALIFGYVARDQIKRTGQSGDGMAIAGIVLGWVGIGFLLIGLVSWGAVWL